MRTFNNRVWGRVVIYCDRLPRINLPSLAEQAPNRTDKQTRINDARGIHLGEGVGENSNASFSPGVANVWEN